MCPKTAGCALSSALFFWVAPLCIENSWRAEGEHNAFKWAENLRGAQTESTQGVGFLGAGEAETVNKVLRKITGGTASMSFIFFFFFPLSLFLKSIFVPSLLSCIFFTLLQDSSTNFGPNFSKWFCRTGKIRFCSECLNTERHGIKRKF